MNYVYELTDFSRLNKKLNRLCKSKEQIKSNSPRLASSTWELSSELLIFYEDEIICLQYLYPLN